MAFLIHFRPTAMSRSQYDSILRRLEEKGEGEQLERTVHVCFGDASRLEVIDVWSTLDAYQRFGDVLAPILLSHGVELGSPQVSSVAHVAPPPKLRGG